MRRYTVKTWSMQVVLAFTPLMSIMPCSAQVDSPAYVPNQVLIQLFNEADSSLVISNHPGLGLEYDDAVFPQLLIFSYHFSSLVSMESCLSELILDAQVVKNAQPNYYVQSPQNNTVPNDPQFGSQYALDRIHAPEAWDISTGGQTVQGHEIVVAVLDDGFDLGHSDIIFWKNQSEIPSNSLDDDENGYVDDYDGWNALDESANLASLQHGTHVSGIIGATGNNNNGISGVNWNVGILPIQVLGTEANEEAIIRGYSYALTMRQMYDASGGSEGAFIVATNASLGSSGAAWHPDDHPLWCQVFDVLGAAGILNVTAPDNYNLEIGETVFIDLGFFTFNCMPAMCGSSYQIVVTNTNGGDGLHDPSGTNALGSPYSINYVDIAAPRVDILSTIPGGGTDYMTGTSMAAPHVAGAIALLYAAACWDLIDQYAADPAGVALGMRDKVINQADLIAPLLPLIGGGRLNVYRSLYSILEQQQTDFELTGTESGPESYAAIHTINAHEYSSVHDLDVMAGEQIDLDPGVLLEPGSGAGQLLVVNSAYFACSVPFAPLQVDLYAPEVAYCGFPLGVACNAIVFGGAPPYTYTWYSKLTSESSWIQSGASYPTMLFFWNDNFHVKVVVTDDNGTTVESDVATVMCLRTLDQDSDGLIEAFDDDLEIVVNPNPNHGSDFRLTILTTKAQTTLSARILDQLGHLVWEAAPWPLDAMVHERMIDLSVRPGTYVVVVESAGSVEYERFVVIEGP